MAGGWGKYDGPLPTLGTSIRAHVWLVVWCKAEGCQTRDNVWMSPKTLAEHAGRLGETMILLEFVKLLKCSACGGKDIDMVVSGTGPQKVLGSYPPPLSAHLAPADNAARPAPPSTSRQRRSRRTRSPF